jgi:hypothetical protein
MRGVLGFLCMTDTVHASSQGEVCNYPGRINECIYSVAFAVIAVVSKLFHSACLIAKLPARP